MMTRFSTMLTAIFAVVVVFGATAAVADDDNAPSGRVTFTKDVLPILQENCQTCHRTTPAGFSGMVAPMSLITYEEVRPWAKSIVKAVQSKEMPPWSASEDFHGVFINERSLTTEQIDTLVKWVNTGAVRGNEEDAPEPRIFPTKEWWLGTPDLEIQLPEPLWVADDIEDWQPMVQIELTEDIFPEDRWMRAIECKPGSEVVHHIVIYAYGPGMDRDRGSGGVGGNIGGLAPGAEPRLDESGFGILIKKGTTLMISMHYHKEAGPGTGTWDQSTIGLFFHPKDAEVREIEVSPIGNMAFEIAPDAPNWEVGMARTFKRPVTLLWMLPHMHFRGDAARYVAYYPDGREEVLLDVPKYSYDWQHSYVFNEPRKLPAGTRVEVQMWFDNSPDNPANPDPKRAVRFGGPTTDEMALGWIGYSFDDQEPRKAADPPRASVGLN